MLRLPGCHLTCSLWHSERETACFRPVLSACGCQGPSLWLISPLVFPVSLPPTPIWLQRAGILQPLCVPVPPGAPVPALPWTPLFHILHVSTETAVMPYILKGCVCCLKSKHSHLLLTSISTSVFPTWLCMKCSDFPEFCLSNFPWGKCLQPCSAIYIVLSSTVFTKCNIICQNCLLVALATIHLVLTLPLFQDCIYIKNRGVLPRRVMQIPVHLFFMLLFFHFTTWDSGLPWN